jgi:hypothetical protein
MDDPASGLDPYLAPIVLREVVEGEERGGPGALVLRGERLTTDPGRPTVYHRRDTVELAGARYEQLVFLWFHGAEGVVEAQGVRVTLDAGGLPAIHEVLADPEGRTRMFVTEGLEAAARERHGPPLEGRRFACEPSREERADVVVPALLAHAPEALGPMVYAAAATGELLGMHCRCEPARLDAIRATVEYELRPLGSLAPEVLAGLEAQLGAEGDFPAADWPLLSLRLPEVF